jgi:chromosome segregation ATPase
MGFSKAERQQLFREKCAKELTEKLATLEAGLKSDAYLIEARQELAEARQELAEARQEIERLRRDNRRLTAELKGWFIKLGEEIDRLRRRDFDLCETIDLLKARKGIISIAAFKKIRSCLHPDRVQDDDLKKRFEEAFNIFSELEMYAVDPKQIADKGSATHQRASHAV